MRAYPSLYRTHLEDYAPIFEDHFKLNRRGGVLEVRMHTAGGSLRWGAEAHRALIPLFQHIDHDEENEVVILTGSGDNFNADPDIEAYLSLNMHKRWDTEPVCYDINYRDQTREPLSLLFLNIPVICAVNGPLAIHAELALVNDIVLASETATFSDVHWQAAGIVPGDGVHTLFRELLGPNRGRYFLYMGQQIDAREALRLGLVGEVLPPEQLLPRAWEIAETVFMTRSRAQRRLTRALLIQPWRELFVRELGSGMAHECLASAISDPVDMAENYGRLAG